MLNLTQSFEAQKDRYAKQLGDFIIDGEASICDPDTIWEYVHDTLQGLDYRVIYRCLDGTVRDMIGRGGVHNSAQDGAVEGIGHAMANREKLTLSFWTATYGDKVNTGAGFGYRTLKAEGILAIRCQTKREHPGQQIKVGEPVLSHEAVSEMRVSM